ncbi:AAA family ATPase [Desulfobulbus rhabdoformis]|uniref:AAA family ATPase n=1 Tax=Desulfobulbus rhabdoformis TaxID=34032 RepID=UPI001964BC4A|nr:AAA family ATPase [Desulfobulbus rhabdoformis]MBM9615243.1 AAA family ATPase [Desulfobulbus rhabdoformis]
MIDLGLAPLQETKRYRAPEVSDDPVEAFRETLSTYGLQPEVIDPTGALIRFDVDRKGDKAGWYVFFGDSIASGTFGNWKTCLKENWCSKKPHELNDEESRQHNERVKKANELRAAQKKLDQSRAKRVAQRMWAMAEDAVSHPYLELKGVPSHFLRQYKRQLLIPLLNTQGEIVNLQRVFPKKNQDGKNKFFLKGGEVIEGSFVIEGDPSLPVRICEGYATGATVHAATGSTVVVAFNTTNLPAVATSVRRNNPDAQLIICADNDQFTIGNPGITAANKTAEQVGAKVVWPEFDDIENLDELRPTDFNDLASIKGMDFTQQVLLAAAPPKGKMPPLTPRSSRVFGRLIKQPDPMEFLFRFNDQGFIPKGVVGVITATGSTGKTFLLLSLAMAAASGGNIGPINVPRSLETLVIVGEDPQDELDRRLWKIGKGQFPESLYAASVYGEVGPFMRLEGGQPVRADGWYWLDETLSNHPGLELLIFDPMSRFYGLDENSNDHATQWIQCLEALAKKHSVTILFSHHTGKQNADKIGQQMARGASAIVDGCRWQAGMTRMDQKTATRLGIERARDYVVLDVPKSNYAPDLPNCLYFKRGAGGVLEYEEPGLQLLKDMSAKLAELIQLDVEAYTRNELVNEKKGLEITRDMKEAFPAFKRGVDMPRCVDHLLNTRKASIDSVGSGRSAREVINVLGDE